MHQMSFFVVERERKSKRGSRGLTQLFSASEPGHFSVLKTENSSIKKRKDQRLVFHLCFEVKFNIAFFLLFKSLKCDLLVAVIRISSPELREQRIVHIA